MVSEKMSDIFQIPQVRAENISLGKDWALATTVKMQNGSKWLLPASMACQSRKELRHWRRGKLVVFLRYSCDFRKKES